MHTNQLIHETSPYLLQHAHNPVHWFAWGPEALRAAKDAQKPILVSIGYAACHWCHVMEKESFENEATAAVMNEHFINIKIDREERPDLDHIYMDAVQAIAGNGGWPLNVFLTPDAKPFYGGTYFPPQKAYGRNSWTEVLQAISAAWHNRRDEIEAQAEQLIGHIRKSNNFAVAKSVISLDQTDALFTKADCEQVCAGLLKNADKTSGGFGAPPKFLQTFSIQYLLQHAHFYDNREALQHAGLSLKKMINGGIYDQLGGGIARYSTDAEWLAPHFEKMLYDNALLVIALCDAYQLTKDEFYAAAIHKTIGFMMREMKHEKGGYYAAIDADSEGVEGKFYVWQKEEISALLGENAALYCTYYNVSETGNWESHNILHITASLAAVAKQFNITEDEAEAVIISCNDILLAVRNERIRPITDDKILLGWNALLLTALCKAHAALGTENYKVAATTLFTFIQSAFKDKAGDGYFHTYKNGVGKFPAFLDDYAWYIQACIQLQEITGDQDYIHTAKALTKFVIENFSSAESDFFFYTHQGQDDVIVRKTELYDGATPSANAVMCQNLMYLSVVFNENAWREKGISMLNGISTAVRNYPGSFAVWACSLQQQAVGINEIVVTGKSIGALRRSLLTEFIPGKVFQSSKELINMPLFEGKAFYDSGFVYLCRNYQCFEPVTTAKELLTKIKNNRD